MASVSSMSAPSQGYCGFKTFIDHQSKCNRFNRVQVINITAAVERILTQLKNGTFPKAKQLPAYIRKVVAAPKTKNLSVYYDPDGSVLLIFKFMNPKGHDPKKYGRLLF